MYSPLRSNTNRYCYIARRGTEKRMRARQLVDEMLKYASRED